MGIDPGKTGGLALIAMRNLTQMEVMPEDSALLIPILERWAPDIVYLEKAQAMPKGGVSGMFSYGQGYGEIIGILKALRIPFVLVRPATWAKVMHKDQGGPTPKSKSQKVALSLFPHMNFLATPRSKKPHEGLVDASIIAEYGAREEYSRSGRFNQNGDLHVEITN